MSITILENCPFPSGLAQGLRFSPQFRTSVQTSKAGYEQRNREWALPLRSAELLPLMRSDLSAQQEMLAFVRRVRGQEYGFPFKIPGHADFRIESVYPKQLTTNSWQAVKRYLSGDRVVERTLTRLDQFSIQTCAGEVEAGEYSVDLSTGIVSSYEGPEVDLIWIFDRSSTADLPAGMNAFSLTQQVIQAANLRLGGQFQTGVVSFAGGETNVISLTNNFAAVNSAVEALTVSSLSYYAAAIDFASAQMAADGRSESLKCFILCGEGTDASTGALAALDDLKTAFPDSLFCTMSFIYPGITASASYGRGENTTTTYSWGDLLMKQLGVDGQFYVTDLGAGARAFETILGRLFGFTAEFSVPCRLARDEVMAEQNGVQHGWPTSLIEVRE